MIIELKKLVVEVTKDGVSSVSTLNSNDTFNGQSFSSVRILSSITEDNIKEVLDFLQNFHPCLIKIKNDI